MKKLLLLLALFAGFILPECADAQLYVNAKYVLMRKHPLRKDAKDVKINRGEKLDEQKGSTTQWFKVRYHSQPGWVHRDKVSKKEPQADPSLKASNNLWAGEDVAAGRAIRGLGPLATKFADKNTVEKRHRNYTDYHQSYITITKGKEDATSRTDRDIQPVYLNEENLEDFLAKGKLGEYADAAAQDANTIAAE